MQNQDTSQFVVLEQQEINKNRLVTNVSLFNKTGESIVLGGAGGITPGPLLYLSVYFDALPNDTDGFINLDPSEFGYDPGGFWQEYEPIVDPGVYKLVIPAGLVRFNIPESSLTETRPLRGHLTFSQEGGATQEYEPLLLFTYAPVIGTDPGNGAQLEQIVFLSRPAAFELSWSREAADTAAFYGWFELQVQVLIPYTTQ